MKLPSADKASVSKEKLRYLLTHPTKAGFFRSIGFRIERPNELKNALKEIARVNKASEKEITIFGTKYTIKGTIDAPNGKTYDLRTIWQIDTGGTQPRLITAHPD